MGTTQSRGRMTASTKFEGKLHSGDATFQVSETGLAVAKVVFDDQGAAHYNMAASAALTTALNAFAKNGKAHFSPASAIAMGLISVIDGQPSLDELLGEMEGRGVTITFHNASLKN